MLRKKLSAIFIFTFILLLVVVCSKPNPTVAVIGNYSKITLDELLSAMSGGHPDPVIADYSLSAAKFGLTKLINTELIYQQAIEAGFDKNPTVVSEFERGYSKMLLTSLYNREILNKIIRESDIRDFYNHTDRDVVAKIVFFSFPRYADKSQRDSVKTIADSVYTLIRKGTDFIEMVNKFSNDETSAKQQGLIGRITWTRSNDVISNTVFSLRVGEISKPVMNRMGYCILKVTEITSKDQKSYDLMRPQILNTLKAEKKGELDKVARTYWDDLKKKFTLTYNDSAVAYWVDQIQSYGQTADKVQEGLSRLDDSTLGTILATYSFGNITLNTVKKKLLLFSGNERFYVANAEVFQSYLVQWVQQDFLQEEAIKKNIHKMPEIIEERDNLLKDLVGTVYTNKIIIGSTEFTDDDVQRYFAANMNSKYAVPEKRTVYEIFIKDPDSAQMLYNRIKSGESFTKLAEQHTERKGYKRRKGLLGDIKENNWGVLGKEAFKIKVGEFTAPIEHPNTSGFSIIKVTKKIKSKTPELQPIIHRVRSDLKRDMVLNRKAQWLSSKKAGITISINEEVLKDVFE